MAYDPNRWTEHALGVHLNQPAREYLRDVGLGYSSIKDNVLSPIEWWESSPYNQAHIPPAPTKAFINGEAFHMHVLDGPKVYNRTFTVLPTRETHPEYLDTVPELVQACARHKLSTHGTKPELIQRLVRAKAPVKILDHERSLAGARRGRRDIPQPVDRRIRKLYAMIMRSPQELRLPDGDHMTLAMALKNALTEVSVYWIDENGIRQRARFDILKPNFTGDLKSITSWNAPDFKRGLLREIVLRGYLIQQAHYFEGRQQLRIAVAEGRVFGGNKTQRKRLEEIAKAEAWGWLFIFGKMDGAAQVRGIVLDHANSRYTKAQEQRTQALAMHNYFREWFDGYDEPWFEPEVIWEPQDEDWPMMASFNEGYY